VEFAFRAVKSKNGAHLLGFGVPFAIRGRSLVRWNALVKAYMPIKFFFGFFFLEENVVYHAQILLRIFGIFPISSALVGAMPFFDA
jgi:hypothetical protein